MSKLINNKTEIVADFMRGLKQSHPDLDVDIENRVVYRKTPAVGDKVALVSGGGSGHEPLHSGFVGLGMLDAACMGEVTTSPTPQQIVRAIEKVSTSAGVLLIVKNYAGDIMNFEIAAERAERNGIKVRSVTVDDDVAGGKLPSDGGRGMGLTVFAEKILGAAAENGMSLDDLCELGQDLRTRGRSMGIGMSSCTHPVAGVPTFELGEDEIEVGIGIHGEPGWRRARAGSAQDTAKLLVESILAELAAPEQSSFIVLVNGMGGTPLIELYVMAGEIHRELIERDTASTVTS